MAILKFRDQDGKVREVLALRGHQGEQGPQGDPGELTVRQGNTFYANALKGRISGAAIRVDDVSLLEHSVPVEVSSKNLIDPVLIPESVTKNGLTLARNGDEITINGTSTASNDIRRCYLNILGAIGETYTFSFQHVSGTVNEGKFYPYLGVSDTIDGGVINWMSLGISSDNLSGGMAVKALPARYIRAVWFFTPAGVVFDNYTFKLQLEKGTTVTPYTPYVPNLTAVTVVAQNKNLINPALIPESVLKNGLTLTRNGDKITINGTAADSNDIQRCYLNIPGVAGETYAFSLQHVSGTVSKGKFYPYLGVSDTPDGSVANWMSLGISADNLSDSMNVKALPVRYVRAVWFFTPAGVVFDNYTFKLQLEKGATVTEYETYANPVTYVPAEDGICKVDSITPTMTLTTDNSGVVMNCEYNRDINKAFEQLVQAIISMGGNI